MANAFVHRIEAALGVDAVSKIAARLKGFSVPVFNAYIVGCVFTLLHTFSVYSFVQHHAAELVELESDAFGENGWASGLVSVLGLNTTQVSPLQIAKQELVLPALLSFVYIILAMTKLIIVYERLTNRSFHNDFPVVMLMHAFPFLKQWSSFAGKLAAQASKLGKS